MHLLEVAKRWQVTGDEILEGHGITAESLSLPGLRIPISTVCDIMERARELTGEPALGIYVGLQMKASWHGYLGFAAMAAQTLGDALRLAAKFAATRTSALSLSLSVEDEVAVLAVDETAPLGAARDTLLFGLLVGFSQIGSELLNRKSDARLDFVFDEPSYIGPFRDSLPDLHFGQPQNALRFDASILATPMPLADAGALELARLQCETQLQALARESDVVVSVKQAIGTGSREAIARKLGMSLRTMKRRLAAAGTSFSELTQDKRREEATTLLKTDVSIDQVAESLGYADSQSFARAFRRWTGMSPSAYRKGAT